MSCFPTNKLAGEERHGKEATVNFCCEEQQHTAALQSECRNEPVTRSKIQYCALAPPSKLSNFGMRARGCALRDFCNHEQTTGESRKSTRAQQIMRNLIRKRPAHTPECSKSKSIPSAASQSFGRPTDRIFVSARQTQTRLGETRVALFRILSSTECMCEKQKREIQRGCV